jgi:hypothetical protein
MPKRLYRQTGSDAVLRLASLRPGQTISVSVHHARQRRRRHGRGKRVRLVVEHSRSVEIQIDEADVIGENPG